MFGEEAENYFNPQKNVLSTHPVSRPVLRATKMVVIKLDSSTGVYMLVIILLYFIKPPKNDSTRDCIIYS